MPAYALYNQLEVMDPDAWVEYSSKVLAGVADFGGRILAADAEAKILEGTWSGIRVVIAEFPDMESLERYHKSDGYRSLLETRFEATRGTLVAVNGLQEDQIRVIEQRAASVS
jgi:uncharacterized protein (DUF1330 family)